MRIGIVGCAGRMGRMLVKETLATPGAELAGGIERAGSPAVGIDLGVLAEGAMVGVVATDSAADLFAVSDVVIDFSTPGATVAHAALAAKSDTALVIGTTGMGPADLAVLLAITSSLRVKALPKGFIAFGEVGLAGEVRPAPRGQERLKEAAKLGFSVAVVPKANAPKKPIEGLEIHAVERVEEAMDAVRGLG